MQKQNVSYIDEKPKYKSQERNRPDQKNDKKLILSNLNFPSLFLNGQYIIDFLPSLYIGIKSKYKEIEKCSVKTDKIEDVLFNIQAFLEQRFNLYKIDFTISDDNEQIISIYKELEYKSFIAYFIEFEKIFKLKHNAKPLYDLLIGFFDKFNISSNSYIEQALEMVKDELKYAKWDKEFFKEVQYQYKGFLKINKAFENAFFDEKILNEYKPKKIIYIELLNLIKKYSKLLDVHLLNKLEIPFSDFEDKESALFFNELFGFVFNNDVIYKEYIMTMINSVFQEYDIVPPLDVMIIKNGKITKDFSIQEGQFLILDEFISKLNTLIETL